MTNESLTYSEIISKKNKHLVQNIPMVQANIGKRTFSTISNPRLDLVSAGFIDGVACFNVQGVLTP